MRKEEKQIDWPVSGHSQVVSPKSLHHIKRQTSLYAVVPMVLHTPNGITINSTPYDTQSLQNPEVWLKSTAHKFTLYVGRKVHSPSRYLSVGNMRTLGHSYFQETINTPKTIQFSLDGWGTWNQCRQSTKGEANTRRKIKITLWFDASLFFSNNCINKWAGKTNNDDWQVRIYGCHQTNVV